MKPNWNLTADCEILCDFRENAQQKLECVLSKISDISLCYSQYVALFIPISLNISQNDYIMYREIHPPLWVCCGIGEATDICCSVAKSCLTLCSPKDCTPQTSLSFTISQSLLKLMSIESMMTSNHLISVTLFSSCPQSFPAPGSFLMSWLFASGSQSFGTSTSASTLPMYIQGLFMLELTGLISLLSKGQKDQVEREVGGGIGMGNTCKSMADSCQCMTKTTTIL